MTTTDPTLEQIEQDLLDRPARKILNTGITLMAAGVAGGLALAQLPDSHANLVERFDAFAACAMVLGGIGIFTGIVVRVLQRGWRGEIHHAIDRAMTTVELERARRDMRQRDELRVGLAELRAEVAQCTANARIVRASKSRRPRSRAGDRDERPPVETRGGERATVIPLPSQETMGALRRLARKVGSPEDNPEDRRA